MNKTDGNDKLFIPFPIGRKKERYFKDKQVTWLFACSIVAVVLIVVKIGANWNSYKFGEKSPIWLIPYIAVILTVWGLIVWKKFLLGDRLLDRFEEHLMNNVIDLSTLWGISVISDKGRIVYTNGSEAYVVKIERSSAKGRSDTFRRNSQNAFAEFVGRCVREKYTVVYYNINNGEPNLKPLSEIQSRILNSPKTDLGRLVNILIGHIRKLLGNIKLENEYLLVLTGKDSLSSSHLEADVKEFMDEFSGTLYDASYIAPKAEVYEFILGFHSLEQFSELDVAKRKRNSNIISTIGVKVSEEKMDYDEFD